MVKFVIALMTLLALFSPTYAHFPVFPSTVNTNVSSAYILYDYPYTYAVYTTSTSNHSVLYFGTNVTKGDAFVTSLYVPANERSLPVTLFIMGPGINGTGSAPGIVVPRGYGLLQATQEPHINLTYEPFAPSTFYSLMNISVTAPQTGRYYLVVRSRGVGNYGVALGYAEGFTAFQTLILGPQVLMAYIWEGQSPILVLLPLILVFAVGFYLLDRRMRDKGKNLIVKRTAVAGSLIILGWAGILLMQMLIGLQLTGGSSEAPITVAFVSASAIVGLSGIYRSVTMKNKKKLSDRAIFAALGIIGFYLSSGLIIGPALLVICGIIPDKE